MLDVAKLPESRQALNDPFVAHLASASHGLSGTIERLRSLRALPAPKPGAYALHETIAAARPATIAALFHALGGCLLVLVPTPDVAERAFADLLYYLGEDRAHELALLRSRDEAIGAIETPSERSARMTLLADLSDGRSRIVLAPIAAARQFLMPPALFQQGRFGLAVGAEAGWEQTQQRLYQLGYTRSDVVSAAGEYAVRGGILDLFPATADAPVRVEFFGDTVESVRSFSIETQRSDAPLQSVDVTPWSEIPRDERYRARILERFDGPQTARRELEAFLTTQGDVPETWLPLAFDERATLFDYVPRDAIVVLDEPGMLATVADALDEERSREQHVLLADVESGDLSIDESHVGEALLAEIAAGHATLSELGTWVARYAALVLPGAIEH
ncbi:MAG TPA: hypothetical protein VNG31_09705, partial [Candidatus Baltobacteraceae bacterium]|nr:hypothetical protein [Candidatus Baltobacteraceae bacterium]